MDYEHKAKNKLWTKHGPKNNQKLKNLEMERNKILTVTKTIKTVINFLLLKVYK